MKIETTRSAGSTRRDAALLAVLLLMLPSAAIASQDDDPYDRPGFYIGVSGAYTHNFFDDQIDDAFEDQVGNVDVDIDDSFGINARIGYRAASFIAFELQYEWIDNFETTVTISGPLGGDATFDITGHTLTANMKLIVPSWRIQPYFLLGAGYALYDVDTNSFSSTQGFDGGKESGFAARAGGGIDWYLTQSLVFSTELTALVTTQDFNKPDNGDIDNLYYLSMSAGLQWRF